jgi:hypothetical protein
MKLVQSSEGRGTVKFMQVLDRDVLRRLRQLGDERGIGIQELIRAVALPEWLQYQEARKKTALEKERKRRKRLRAWRARHGAQAC